MQTFSQMLSEYDYDLMRIDEIKFSEIKKKTHSSHVSWLIGKSNYILKLKIKLYRYSPF